MSPILWLPFPFSLDSTVLILLPFTIPPLLHVFSSRVDYYNPSLPPSSLTFAFFRLAWLNTTLVKSVFPSTSTCIYQMNVTGGKHVIVLTDLILNSWLQTSTRSSSYLAITPYIPRPFTFPSSWHSSFSFQAFMSLPIWPNQERFPHPPPSLSASLLSSTLIHLGFLAIGELCFGLKSAFLHVDAVPSLLLTQECRPCNSPLLFFP